MEQYDRAVKQYATWKGEVKVEEVRYPEDFDEIFQICAEAFGHQTNDGIWTAMNPDWHRPEGRKQGVARMVSRFDKSCQGEAGMYVYTRFVKVSLPCTGPEGQRIIGIAIWVLASLDPEKGVVPEPLDFSNIYPGDADTAEFLKQALNSLHKHRRGILQEKAAPDSKQKSVMILDLCAVHPHYQYRGVGTKLVQWGLDEARRQGGFETITEASVMGRSVYKKLGFQEVAEIQYEVDERIRDRSLPSNVFVRRPGDPVDDIKSNK